MDWIKRGKYIIPVFGKIFILLFLFYHKIFVAFFGAIVFSIIQIKKYKKHQFKEWQKKINLEFREGLQGIAAALQAGYSMENALIEAKNDLYLLYGDNSVLIPEFEKMITGIGLNQTVESVFEAFAKKSQVEDVLYFAEVLSTARRTGGDLIAITKNSANRISEKIEVAREIETIVSGKKMESQIMNYIPLGIIVYFWLCSPGFLDSLYQGTGIIVMSVLLLIYLVAYFWSVRICDITV